MARVILVYEPKRAGTYADLLERAIPNPADYRLIPCTSREEAERAIGEAEILFCFRFPADLLQGAHRLRWIQAMAAGVDDLVAAPLPPGVLLTRIEGLFGTPMSEYAFAHMLAHAQQLRRVYAAQAERRWDPFRAETLAGKRLGVAGIGSIGLEVAVRGKAFGMEVWGLARTPGPRPHVDRVFTPDQVREFTAGVDFLVSTLPDTPETHGLIDPEGMKEGALPINVGRGATLDEGALLRGRCAAAASGRCCDVFTVERAARGPPLLDGAGHHVTPHMSGLNRPDAIAAYSAENLRRFERGEPLRGVVDLARGYWIATRAQREPGAAPATQGRAAVGSRRAPHGRPVSTRSAAVCMLGFAGLLPHGGLAGGRALPETLPGLVCPARPGPRTGTCRTR